MKRKFLLFLLLCMPFTLIANANDNVTQLSEYVNRIENAESISDAGNALTAAYTENIDIRYQTSVDKTTRDEAKEKIDQKIAAAMNSGNAATPDQSTPANAATPDAEQSKKNDERTDAEKKKALEEKTKAYEDAKANEQSLANRTLTATSMAATGLGAMELMQGLAEKNADADAQQDMAAYLSTFRCSYASGKSVKGGTDEIELPGGNDQNMMNLRAEYFALAQSLKERKTALNLKPGIESEEILDKSQTGLYDDENTGITDGAYESLYRAQMLNSEKDKAAIDAAADKSQKRVLGGAIAAGAGVVIGVAGNALINGELGKKLKEAINNRKAGAAMKKFVKEEEDGLKKIKSCLKKAGANNTDDLTLDYMSPFYPSLFSFDKLSCAKDLTKVKNLDAKELFTKIPRSEQNNNEDSVNGMIKVFGAETTGKLLGVTISAVPKPKEITSAAESLEKRAETMKKRYEDALESDKNSSNSNLLNGSDIKDKASGLISGGISK